MSEGPKIIKPIHAREGEHVDIHWHCGDSIYIERYTCPPRAVRDARKVEGDSEK